MEHGSHPRRTVESPLFLRRLRSRALSTLVTEASLCFATPTLWFLLSSGFFFGACHPSRILDVTWVCVCWCLVTYFRLSLCTRPSSKVARRHIRQVEPSWHRLLRKRRTRAKFLLSGYLAGARIQQARILRAIAVLRQHHKNLHCLREKPNCSLEAQLQS